MSFKCVIIYFIFSWLFLTKAISQTPYYKSLDIATGFPCNTVYDVYQSRNGFIWLASDVGLYSFDGFDIKNYENNNPVAKAVTNILEDESGRIWCQSFKGVFYYVQGDSLVIEKRITDRKGFFSAQMLSKNIIASATNQGVSLYNIKTRKLTTLVLPNFNVIGASYNDNDTLVLQSYFGDKFYKVTSNGVCKSKAQSKISRSYFTIRFNRKLFAISKEYPFEITFESGVLKELKLGEQKNLYINNIKEISKDRLAISTTNGLYLLDKDLNVINEKGYFSDANVSNVCEDTEGNFWISTLNKGVIFTYQLSILCDKLEYFFSNVCNSKTDIYFGTLENTVVKMDIKSRAIDTLFYSPLKHTISNLLYNSNKHELVFTNHHFNLLNTQTTKLTTIDIKPNDVDTLDGSHYILAHNGGLSIYPNDNSSIVKSWKKTFSVVSKNMVTCSNPIEYQFVLKLNNSIFASSSNGLFEYTKDGVKELVYGKEPLSINNLGYINNELIVITYNYGILKYTNNKLVSFFNKENGLDKSDIYRAKTYENKLYILQYEGMQRFDPKTRNNSLITMADGVESDLDDFIVLRDTIYATNFEGILVFKLDATLATKSKPKLILNNLYANDIIRDSLTNATFNHNQNNIKINYSLIDFRGKKYTKVYYKLNDGNWVETSAKNKELLFTALEPNKYIIQLKAVNYRNYESNKITLNFTILPPFYKTWWFMSLVILGIVGCIVLISVYRIRAIKKRQAEILEKERLHHELDLSNIKSLRAQMNPHFLYNALNAIQSLIYTGDKSTASESLGIFSDLSRGVLESSRSPEISLYDELDLINNYLSLEKLRLPKINYTLFVDPNLNLHDTYLPTMIIQPLIENAIYHGLSNKIGEGKLAISLQLDNNKLVITINDDGIGREAASKLRQRALKKSASFSTKANITRIELLNTNKEHKIEQTITDLYHSDGSSAGTEVILIIPINYND